MATEQYKPDPPTEYYVISREGLTLHMNPDVLRTLAALVHPGPTGLPRRELDMVGLLLGYEGYDGSEVRLEAVHAVTIEHLLGPSYQLSDSDIKVIEQTIGELSSQFWLRIVGHFRSQVKGEIEITDADRTISALTGAPEPLVLLLRGSSIGPSFARLYLGSSSGFIELLGFLLTPGVTNPAIPQEEEPSPKQTAPGSPEIDIAYNPPERDVVVRQPRWRDSAHRVWAKTLSVTGLLVFVTLVFYLLSSRPSTSIVGLKKRLGLSVRPSDGQLIVRWNPSSPAVRTGIFGVLMIRDGDNQHKIPLTPRQLGSGTIGYAPQTSTVEFRLEVYRDQLRYTDELVRIIGAPLPEEALPGQSTQDRTVHSPINRPISGKEHPGNKVNRSVGRSLRLQLHDSRPETETETPEPSESNATETPAPAILLAPLLAQALVAPPTPDVPQTRAPFRFEVKVPEAPPSTVSYVAPIPIRKTSPSVPANLRHLIQHGVSIEVKVMIDTQGEVISATPLHLSSSNSKLLSSAAVQAARFWRFEPARLNGKPVASESILKFNFEPRER